jgi:type II secretory pathway predicted ATPase ExeA/septal ring-binding cell division protein DamX
VDSYISQQKSQMLDSLENQVRFSQLVAVIVGDKGMGKSFLLKRLQQRLDQEVIIASIDASLAMTDEQLDKSLSLQLGLSWQSSDVGLAQRIQNDIVQKVLISVDDAHLLSASCVDYLLRLNQQQLQFEESVLFVLLAGESSLPALISQTETYLNHQEMCVVFQIEPIQQTETLLLINALAEINPEIKKVHYDVKKLDYFWQLSKGNPAELNYHISRWLDDKAPPQVIEIADEKPTSYFSGLLYLVIAVGLVTLLIFQDDINQTIFNGNDSPEVAGETVKVPAIDNEKLADAKSAPKKKVGDNTVPLGEELEQANSDDLIEGGDTKDAPTKQQELALPVDQQTESEQLVQKKERIEEPLETDKPLVSNSNESDPISENNPPTSKQSKPDKIEVKAQSLTSDEQALLFMNSEGFAFQWVGLSDFNSASKYRSKHRFADKLKIYRRTTANKTLYLVVSGEFEDHKGAERALNQLAQQGILTKPWIKSIGAIQSEINRFQNSQ